MNDNPIRQRGSALFLALVFLFMLSILGATAMQSSSLEYRMATNAIESKAAFQSAESVTEEALNSDSNISAAFTAGINGFKSVNLTLNPDSPIASEAKLQYVGSGIVPGSSIGLFEGLRFIAAGEGSIGGQAGAGVKQGAVRVVPAD